MKTQLEHYINTLHRRPDQLISLQKLHDGFVATLPAMERKLVQKWATRELLEALGFTIGIDCRGIMSVAGLSDSPSPYYQRTNGELRLVRP